VADNTGASRAGLSLLSGMQGGNEHRSASDQQWQPEPMVGHRSQPRIGEKQNSFAGPPLVISIARAGALTKSMQTANRTKGTWALLAMKRVVIRTVVWHCPGYGGI
jgi:hypothetical protein